MTMEIVIGAAVYMFVGAFMHGLLFGNNGDMKTLFCYLMMWPFIIVSLISTRLRNLVS